MSFLLERLSFHGLWDIMPLPEPIDLWNIPPKQQRVSFYLRPFEPLGHDDDECYDSKLYVYHKSKGVRYYTSIWHSMLSYYKRADSIFSSADFKRLNIIRDYMFKSLVIQNGHRLDNGPIDIRLNDFLKEKCDEKLQTTLTKPGGLANSLDLKTFIHDKLHHVSKSTPGLPFFLFETLSRTSWKIHTMSDTGIELYRQISSKKILPSQIPVKPINVEEDLKALIRARDKSIKNEMLQVKVEAERAGLNNDQIVAKVANAKNEEKEKRKLLPRPNVLIKPHYAPITCHYDYWFFYM